jgi:Tfp pilus assembly protein PilF
MAWARLGFALYKLKEPTEVWRGAYQSAYPLLTGEERGRAILNEGYCLGQNGQRFEAQAVLLQALTCFKNNPYFLAWTRYNIAMYALHELAPHAEKQFLEAIRHSHSPKAAGLRPAASNGLGAFRRSQGEWKRAEAAYRTALRLASDPHDRQQAHQGIARTQYLAGQPGKALETLAIALQDPSLDPTMLYVYQALAFLTQGDPKAARNALRQAGEIESDSDRWLYRIARAELARLDGTEAEAVALLEGLPLESLHAREEVRQWPRLFELVAASGGGLPQPLEHSDHTTIEVQALGMARVWVNGREVPLAPLNRATELLVALLEKGGQATSHQLIEMLWPNTKVSEKRRHLSELIGNLREALGWPSSVRTVDRGYALADEALWLYDVQDARAKGQAEGIFMDGLYSNWVQEVNEELNAYRQLN